MLHNISHTVDVNTTIANSTVAAIEGSSVTISRISTGTPTPFLSCKLDGQPVLFQTTEAREQSAATLVRSDPDNSNSPFVPNIVLGRVISNLLIVNANILITMKSTPVLDQMMTL